MHAIIETGGKQFRVAPGDVIRVEKLAGDVGSAIELPAKAAFGDGGALVAASAVKATIVGNGRADKIIVFKFKRKKQYKKTIGHRQSYTTVKVDEIVGPVTDVTEHEQVVPVEPVTAEPVAAESVTAEPVAAESVAVEPVTVEPAPVDEGVA